MIDKPEHDGTNPSLLGAFLKAHRARLTPTAAGLAIHGRRRTQGLRREELAQLCGVSTTWITWMEQGRPIKPSATVLDRLSRTLQLSEAERAYLYHLAQRTDPASGRPHTRPSHAALKILPALTTPAYVLDRYWYAVAWNDPAAELFVGWLDQTSHPMDPSDTPPHLLRYLFLSPHARTLIQDWDIRARRLVAEFRADAGKYANDPGVRAISDELCAQSAPFKALWSAQDVVEREGGRRTFCHPARGILSYEQTTLIPATSPDLKLVILLSD